MTMSDLVSRSQESIHVFLRFSNDSDEQLGLGFMIIVSEKKM